jgi:hypothetical protein
MVDNGNLARSFAPPANGDDPLAELERLVSGKADQRLQPQSIKSFSARPMLQAAAFDLEDALMQELGNAAQQRKPAPEPQASAPMTVVAAPQSMADSLEDQLMAELSGGSSVASQPFVAQPVTAPLPVEGPHNADVQESDWLDDAALHEAAAPIEAAYADEYSDALFGAEPDYASEFGAGYEDVAHQPANFEDPQYDADLSAAFEAELAQNLPAVGHAHPAPASAHTQPARPAMTEREIDDQFAQRFAEEIEISLGVADAAFDPIASDAADDPFPQDSWQEPVAVQQPQARVLPQVPNRRPAQSAAGQDMAFAVPPGGDPANWQGEAGQDFDDAFVNEGLDDGDGGYQPASQVSPLRRLGFGLPWRSLGAMMLVGVVVLGGGYFAYSSMGSAPASGEPPIVKADTEPVKVKPENPGGLAIANQDQAAYEKVAGASPDGQSQEKLVSKDEAPVDIAAVAEPTAAAADQPLATSAETGKEEERLSPGSDENTGAIPALAPRKVKTMVIRADGTVVPAEEDAKLAATQPVTDPASNVSALIPVEQNARDAAAEVLKPIDPEAQGEAKTRSVPGEPVAKPEETANAAGNPDPATTKPVETQQALLEQPAAVGSGEWAVQLASQRSPEDAQKTFQNLKRQFPGVLDGKPLAVQKAEVQGKGVFYRVRVPTETKEEAVELCNSLKAAGGSCFPTK